MANNTAVVKVLADNADLTRKLAASEKKIKRFESAAKRAGKNSDVFGGMASGVQKVGGPLGTASSRLGGFASALSELKSPAGIAAGALAGVAGAVKLIDSSIDTLTKLTGETKVLKRETGMATETASLWVGVGSRVNVGASQLSTGFGIMSKKFKVATSDSKSAGKALELFASAGVSEATLRSGDMNEILLSVADTFKAMPDGPKQTALATDLFGRSGKRLIPILNKGRDGIIDVQEELTAYGKIITDDTEGQVTDLKVAQKKLNEMWDGAKITLATKVMPWLSKYTSKLTTAVTEARLGKQPTSDLSRILGNLGKAFSFVKDNAGKLAGIFSRLFPQVTVGFQIVKTVVLTNWGRMWNGLKAWATNNWRRVKKPFEDLKTAISRGANKFGEIGSRAGRGLWNGIKKGARGIIGWVKGVLNGLIGAIESGINRMIDLVNGAIGLYNRVPGALRPTDKIGKVGKVSIPRLAEGGIVTRPTLALIGEAGPEAVVPLSGRNAREAGVGGGNTFNITNIGGALDEQQLARSIGWQLATRGLA